MVKTREEIMEMIKTRVGEDTSDEAISFMEDVTDTLNDYERKLKIPEGYEFMGGVALGERVNTPEEPEQRRGTWTIID